MTLSRQDVLRIAEECGIPEFENNESQAENIYRFYISIRDLIKIEFMPKFEELAEIIRNENNTLL